MILLVFVLTTRFFTVIGNLEPKLCKNFQVISNIRQPQKQPKTEKNRVTST